MPPTNPNRPKYIGALFGDDFKIQLPRSMAELTIYFGVKSGSIQIL
jgi:hypothetical protein